MTYRNKRKKDKRFKGFLSFLLKHRSLQNEARRQQFLLPRQYLLLRQSAQSNTHCFLELTWATPVQTETGIKSVFPHMPHTC